MAKQVKKIVSSDAKPAAAKAEAQTPAPEKREFDGIAYDQIVEAVLRDWEIYGRPAEGNRNTVLYRLVRELRYVCEFSAPFVMAVLPDWGLPREEVQQTVASALASPRGTEMPPTLRGVLARLKGATEPEAEPVVQPEDKNPVPKNLPPLLRHFVQLNPRTQKCVLLASLPILGTMLCRLRSEYFDGKMEAPVFMVAIVGPQASGKSFLSDLYQRMGRPLIEADRKMRERENEYKDRVRKAKNAKTQPELETFPIRLLPASVSNTQLLKRADVAAGKALLSFAPEVDTILRSNRSGAWAEKGDIYRIGFEGGMYGQDYASESSYSAVVELRYNLLFSGTDSAMRRFFKNVENGMNSRFCFAQMADDRGQKIQRTRIDSRELVKVDKELERLYALGEGDGDVCISLPKTLKALDKWTEQRIEEYLQTGNDALDILRRRSCLIGFRAAMIAWALSDCKETPFVPQFALWVATETLQQQMAFFGEELNEVDKENREIREKNEQNMQKTRNARFYDELPDEFTTGDLESLRHSRGFTGKNCSYIITRWMKRGLVEAVGIGKFVKKQKQITV